MQLKNLIASFVGLSKLHDSQSVIYLILISILHSIIINFLRTIYHLGRLSLPKPYIKTDKTAVQFQLYFFTYLFTVIANDVNYTSVTRFIVYKQ